jgi:cytochrome c peroxidase
MAEDINTVILKLQSDSLYPSLFKSAFGDETINSQRMLFAIAQFVGSMVSADSKYDKVKKGQAVFTDRREMATSCSRLNAPVAMPNHCSPI